MIPELGHFALILALMLALAQSVLPLWGAQARDARLMESGPPLALAQMVAVGAAFAALLWAFVTNDTTVSNVVANSHSAKPMIFKLSGAWGNHEGSMVLWVLVLALCSAAVAGFGRDLPSALRARVLAVLGMISTGFLLFILATSNPFDRVWPPPLDGQGLNPLLQDIGLALHPPLLYLGYVGYAVTFAFAVAALIEGRVDAAWGRWVRPWSLAAWSFLTLGIGLGSWWAYYELGWGGYWFWDPVENASLLPWLAGTALLHSAVVVEKREALKIWTVLLALLAFALSLLGTFLVRSGVLNSVHAFASDPARGVFILVLLGIYIAGAFALFAFRAPAMAPQGVFAPVSREGGIVLNNLLLCSLCAVVLVGTLYPLFLDLLAGRMISVGPPFFNLATLPLALPLAMAMAAGPLLAWKRAALWPVIQRLWWAAALALLAFLLAMFLAGAPVMPALGFAIGLWLIAGAATDILDRSGLGRTGIGNALRRAGGLPRAAWGAAIAHAGVGVTVLGIAGMGMATEKLIALTPGASTEFAGYEWRLEGVRDFQGANYTARRATVTVLRDGRTVQVMEPSKRFFPIGRTTTTETAIRTNGLRDLYAVLGEERDGADGRREAVLRLHYNLLAPFLWIGSLIMALGGGLSLTDRRMRVAAPARRAAAQGAPA
ncbi:heme lyase CcmF/NrfE family subunit [Sabulicella glaciei]|uniref:Heme lyase CcmF/NrfE family subunit n=1 Tax=Sabulicella glaciei TaxID=2984948 RepID=A0ABT3NY16_9PROT|nr:heme lyase CcmF/NrfE family subunit [Roseococcus sp. MDT2-1-1]MCW8087062.1 heme lyase CcmF/NrfE family subunit [Roseococcus sp. MDT2-1-1]